MNAPKNERGEGPDRLAAEVEELRKRVDAVDRRPPAAEPRTAEEAAGFLYTTLGRENTREFENEIVAWVRAWPASSPPVAALEALLDTPQGSCTVRRADGSEETVRFEDVAFPAFFALCSCYRRQRCFDLFAAAVQRHGDRFVDVPLHHHLLAMLHTGQGGSCEDVREGLEHAETALSRPELSDHPGVLHHFAEAVAIAAEKECLEDPAVVARAAAALARALKAQSPTDPARGKFHATRARLHAVRGEYGKAFQEIEAAIRMEERNPVDYAFRIVEYQQHFARIQIKEHREEVAAARSDFEEAIRSTRRSFEEAADQVRREHLTILGVFAAIVSVAVGSFALIGNAGLGFGPVAGSIVILALSMLVLYAGFNVLFLRPERLAPTVWIGVLGLGLIAAVYAGVWLTAGAAAPGGAPASATAGPRPALPDTAP